jgi:predicted Zn finger-like uncharacterized protein
MALATRCPACGTVFRVVSDQLKVSEGWVRCGRCSEVFNAAQRLFELEPDAAPAAPPQGRPVAEVHQLPLRDPAATSPAQTPPNAVVPAEPEQVPAAQAAPVEAPAKTPAALRAEPAAPPLDEPPHATPQQAPAEPDSGAQADGGSDVTPAAEAVEALAEAKPAEASGPAPTPEFVRRADLAARWRHPARRGLLATVALLLLALLGGQMAMHYRDHVAAAWPGTRPWLQAVCTLTGCRIEAPRRIESLNVDSSGLVRLQDSPLYRLSLVVQNRAPTSVLMPAIDLALTDGLGQTTARRVLSAAELGSTAESLPAGGEITLQATLDLGERRVAGYTVELFYP